MIGRFWHWLTDAHHHEWETAKENPYIHWKTNLGGEKYKAGEGILYTLRCKTCGDITSRKVGI